MLVLCASFLPVLVHVLLVPLMLPMNKNLSICSWNVRGLGQASRRDDVLAELISVRPTIAALQETKLPSLLVQQPASFLPSRLRHCVARDSTGASGGSSLLGAMILAASVPPVLNNLPSPPGSSSRKTQLSLLSRMSTLLPTTRTSDASSLNLLRLLPP